MSNDTLQHRTLFVLSAVKTKKPGLPEWPTIAPKVVVQVVADVCHDRLDLYQ
jgi:hypothetical protein